MSFHTNPQLNACIQRDTSVFMSADQTSKPEEKKPEEKPPVPGTKVTAMA